jgi:ABC-type transport system involved in multi-copper enzyme maturation permease subunit
MTAQDISPELTTPPHERATSRWLRIESALEDAAEHLNPILIKEARQALKSRQFTVTFLLLLLLAWAWSLLGIAILMPGVYYASGGRFMLVGYFVALILPMLIVVPFSAFRSIAVEQEDATYELLTITNLTARQIVTGKLGSSMLQMLVYFSALAPCIAFTYLLRGLDVVSIVLTLSYVFLASVTLSVVGLLLGTLTRSRHWNTLLSVLFLIGLLIVAFTSFQFTAILVMAHPPLDTASFWITNLLVVTILGSFLVLAILAAAGNISFASDNRSTRLRIVMFVQQMLFIGALTYGWLMGEDAEILLMLIGLVASYWMFMGTLMIGESGQLSLRARRRLPTSFLSRACFTWFNPGPGTGYLFAVLNLFTVWLIYVAMLTASQLTGFRGQPDSPGWLLFGSLTVAYAALFLGLDRILLLLMNRLRISITMLTSLLVQICLLLVTSSVPFIVTLWASDFRGAEYSLLQCPNWLWTLQAAAFGMYDTPTADIFGWAQIPSGYVVATIIMIAALATFVVNLILARREVDFVRLQTPRRVLEDEQLRHPTPVAKPPVVKNPFQD